MSARFIFSLSCGAFKIHASYGETASPAVPEQIKITYYLTKSLPSKGIITILFDIVIILLYRYLYKTYLRTEKAPV